MRAEIEGIVPYLFESTLDVLMRVFLPRSLCIKRNPRGVLEIYSINIPFLLHKGKRFMPCCTHCLFRRHSANVIYILHSAYVCGCDAFRKDTR